MVEDHHERNAEIKRRCVQKSGDPRSPGGARKPEAFREAEFPEQRGKENIQAVAGHAAKAGEEVFIRNEGRFIEQRKQVEKHRRAGADEQRGKKAALWEGRCKEHACCHKGERIGEKVIKDAHVAIFVDGKELIERDGRADRRRGIAKL